MLFSNSVFCKSSLCCVVIYYLLWLVGIGEGCDHPYDVEIIESSTGGERTRQDDSLTSGHLNTALTHCHLQSLNTNCRGKHTTECTRRAERNTVCWLFHFSFMSVCSSVFISDLFLDMTEGYWISVSVVCGVISICLLLT